MGETPLALAGKKTFVERNFRFKTSLKCIQTRSRYGPYWCTICSQCTHTICTA